MAAGDGSQMAGRTIWDQDNGRRRADEGHQRLNVKAALFYADDGMVASTDPGWLQMVFDILTGIFYQVVQHMNV